MMPKCSASATRASKTFLAACLLSMMAILQVSGATIKGNGRHRDDGDDDDDDSSHSHSSSGGGHAAEVEQKLDTQGLEDSLKSGGAEGLASMLAAMGAMKHDTGSLIPVTKDANGNAMYNFGALMTTAPPATVAPVVATTQAASPPAAQPAAPPAAQPAAPPASLMKTAAVVMSTAAPDEQADDALVKANAAKLAKTMSSFEHQKAAPSKGLRGSSTEPAAANSASADAPPKAEVVTSNTLATPRQVSSFSSVMPAAVAPLSARQGEPSGLQVDSLRQGLAAIRDRVDSLMKESDGMLFGGSQVNMQESQGQQQQWAEMLRRVSALEDEHASLQKQVRTQDEHIQALENEESTEKQQLVAAVKNNTVLRTDADDAKQQLLQLEQQHKQLEADDKQTKDQLLKVEQDNKHLHATINARKQQAKKHQKAKPRRKAVSFAQSKRHRQRTTPR